MTLTAEVMHPGDYMRQCRLGDLISATMVDGKVIVGRVTDIGRTDRFAIRRAIVVTDLAGRDWPVGQVFTAFLVKYTPAGSVQVSS